MTKNEETIFEDLYDILDKHIKSDFVITKVNKSGIHVETFVDSKNKKIVSEKIISYLKKKKLI